MAGWLFAIDASGDLVVAMGLALAWLSVLLALTVMVGFDLLFIPIQREAAAALPLDVEPGERGLPLAVKVMFAVAAAAWATAVQTIAFTADSVTRDERFLVFSLVVIPAAAYSALLVWTLVASPLLRPIRELRAATRRVAEGDFTVRVPTATTDELGELVASFNAMQHGLQERAALHAAFGTYVDPRLAERVMAEGDAAFAGEEVDVTVFFVDVRGFTSFAERVQVTDAFALLNRLFGVIVPVVRAHGGHPNRYLGDGLLAVFGAPVAMPDHAGSALRAASEIHAAVTSAFEGSVRIGIGINTGTVIAGTIGGGGKLEYTVIGDAVNVAARVEQLTKTTDDPILLTDTTVQALRDRPALVDRGSYAVPGKADQVHVYALPQ